MCFTSCFAQGFLRLPFGPMVNFRTGAPAVSIGRDGVLPPTPAALPIANTRPQRASLAATAAAIQNSVQKLAATTRLGVKKKIYPN